MKTKLLYLFAGLAFMTFAACEKESVAEEKQVSQMKNPGTNPVENIAGLSPCVVVNLMAGQNYDSGDLSVYFDLDNVYVEYKTTGDWYIRKTHLYVGSYSLIPTNNGGNPVPGQFPINNVHPGGTQSIVYTIPKTTLPECFCVVAHAEATRVQNGVVVQTETAWGAGERFSQKGWATFFRVCQSDCFDIEDYYFGSKN